MPTVLPGDGTIQLPTRADFIGRRTFIRQHLRAFLDGDRRCLVLTGPGGVGKTTLAGLLARRLHERYPTLRLLGFRAPFDLKLVYEALWHEAFDGSEDSALLPRLQAEADVHEQMRLMLTSLARRQRPCAFVLDNLEALQDLHTLRIAPAHEESLCVLRTICALPAPTRVLLTGRYALQELTDGVITPCPVEDAPYGDVLRKMSRLPWRQEMSAEDKHTVYTVLGGNHRAIEWMAQVVSDQPQKSDELLAVLQQLEAPPGTPVEAAGVVLEAMRQNLLLSTLREQLTPAQDLLLRAACLYRVSVNEDGLRAIESQPEQAENNWQRLVAYALFEIPYDPELDLQYFVVPPVVKELIGQHGFDAQELQALHRAMGAYHAFQVEYLSRRLSDALEAVYHYRCADEHTAADSLARDVSNVYYAVSNFTGTKTIAEEIVVRAEPPPPWWALNLYGLCQLRLGFLDSAQVAFERALPVAPSQRDRGTTLNNLSQIYKARGDYDTALRYLEQSLQIQRDIGDKAGEGTTLHNMGFIALEARNLEQALSLWTQALHIALEIREARLLFHTTGTLGRALAQAGARDEAKPLLQMAIQVGTQAGLPGVDEIEAMLRQLA